MAATALVFLEPAVQHVGVHALLARQCRDGSTGLLACLHQLGLELRRVGPMRAPGRVSGNLCFFEHGVHDLLRAHYLARGAASDQDGFAGRLRYSRREGVMVLRLTSSPG